LAANEVSKHASDGYFSFGKCGRCWLFSDFVVPNVFPNVFGHNVSNSTSIYPISFALSSILVTYIISQKEGDYNISISGLSRAGLQLCFMGQSLMPITKEKKLNCGDLDSSLM
jgi:hypothetical protein